MSCARRLLVHRRSLLPDPRRRCGVVGLNRLRVCEVGGHFEGAPLLLLLHATGARTGCERVNPMMYQDLGGGSVAVFASEAGARANPDWIRTTTGISRSVFAS
jgi:hypothetical protein